MSAIYDDKPNEYYLTMLKSKIINKILNDENTVKLIAPEQSDVLEQDDILLGGSWKINGSVISKQGHVFDFAYVNETTEEEKVFICIEALPFSYSNPVVGTLLSIHIYVHKELMRLTNSSSPLPSTPTSTEMAKLGLIGNRCDMLTQTIGKLLNGCDDIGGISSIKPYSENYIAVETPNNNFYGKVMYYKVLISDTELLDEC